MKHDFHQRRENRIAGAEEKASKNEAESDRLYQLSQKMADAIPMGQPILIGHHSEKADRRYRDKISGVMRRSIERMVRLHIMRIRRRASKIMRPSFPTTPKRWLNWKRS